MSLGIEGEMFVHKNLGALVSKRDLSTKSAVEWCVDLLKVCLEKSEKGRDSDPSPTSRRITHMLPRCYSKTGDVS